MLFAVGQGLRIFSVLLVGCQYVVSVWPVSNITDNQKLYALSNFLKCICKSLLLLWQCFDTPWQCHDTVAALSQRFSYIVLTMSVDCLDNESTITVTLFLDCFLKVPTSTGRRISCNINQLDVHCLNLKSSITASALPALVCNLENMMQQTRHWLCTLIVMTMYWHWHDNVTTLLWQCANIGLTMSVYCHNNRSVFTDSF